MAVSVKAGAPGAVGELLLSPSFVTVLVLEIGSRSLVLASASPAVLVELCPSGRGLFALGTSLATAVLATGCCNSVLAPSLVAFESLRCIRRAQWRPQLLWAPPVPELQALFPGLARKLALPAKTA